MCSKIPSRGFQAAVCNFSWQMLLWRVDHSKGNCLNHIENMVQSPYFSLSYRYLYKDLSINPRLCSSGSLNGSQEWGNKNLFGQGLGNITIYHLSSYCGVFVFLWMWYTVLVSKLINKKQVLDFSQKSPDSFFPYFPALIRVCYWTKPLNYVELHCNMNRSENFNFVHLSFRDWSSAWKPTHYIGGKQYN